MDLATAGAWIERWEGRRNQTYTDTMGHRSMPTERRPPLPGWAWIMLRFAPEHNC